MSQLPDELKAVIFGCLSGPARTSTRQLSHSYQTEYVRRSLALPSPRRMEDIAEVVAIQVKALHGCSILTSLCMGHAHVDVIDRLPDLTCLTSLIMRRGKFPAFSGEDGLSVQEQLMLVAGWTDQPFVNLVHVDISGMAMEMGRRRRYVGGMHGNMLRLDFPNLKRFWAVGCKDVVGICLAAPKLQELVLRGCPKLIVFMGDGYPHLEVLDLGLCPQHCQMELAKVLESSPSLRWLSLDGTWDTSRYPLSHDEDPCRYLVSRSVVARCVQYLDVSAGEQVEEEEGLAKMCVVGACPNVTELFL